jgi:hypothetical protein
MTTRAWIKPVGAAHYIINDHAHPSARAVPLASGASAESRQQIGLVIVGGLLGGTFFTLFAVPFVYAAVKGRRRKS